MSVIKQQHTIDGTCLPPPPGKGAKEGENNPSTGFAPDVLPEVRIAFLPKTYQEGCPPKMPCRQQQ